MDGMSDHPVRATQSYDSQRTCKYKSLHAYMQKLIYLQVHCEAVTPYT